MPTSANPLYDYWKLGRTRYEYKPTLHVCLSNHSSNETLHIGITSSFLLPQSPCLERKSLLLAVHADTSPAPVLDIEGESLRSGVQYWILPVIRGKGGGLTLASNGNINRTKCPLDVVQEQYEVSNGLPLTLSPVNLKKGVVRLSTDLNIKFSTSAAITISLHTSKVWKLVYFNASTGQYFITTGGVEGNPGPQTISNWFKIEKYDKDYKLIFCPPVCNFCKVICRDVGIYLANGIRRLALSDVPLKVMFKRV